MLRRAVPSTAAVMAATAMTAARRTQSSMWSFEPPRQEIAPTNKKLDTAYKIGGDLAHHSKATSAKVDARRREGKAFKWERGDAADELGDDAVWAGRRELEEVKRSRHDAESHRYSAADTKAKHAKREQRNHEKWWTDRKPEPTPWPEVTKSHQAPRLSFSARGLAFSAQRDAQGKWAGKGESWEVPTQDVAALRRMEKPITAVRQQWDLNPKTMTFEQKKKAALELEAKRGKLDAKKQKKEATAKKEATTKASWRPKADVKKAVARKHIIEKKKKAAVVEKKLRLKLTPQKAKAAHKRIGAVKHSEIKKKLKLSASPKAVHKKLAAHSRVQEKVKALSADRHLKKHHKEAAKGKAKSWEQTPLDKSMGLHISRQGHKIRAATQQQHDPNSSHLQKVEWRFDTKTGSWEEWHQDMQTGRWTLAVDDSKIHARQY